MNAVPQKTWWSRNWRWFVPSGCMTLLVMFAALIFGVMSLVFGMMKSSDVYKQAVMRATHQPAVIAALGEPIATGYFCSGNIKTSNDDGEADLTIPIHGPRGEASIHLRASKRSGIWSYSELIVGVDARHQRIDLLQSRERPSGN